MIIWILVASVLSNRTQGGRDDWYKNVEQKFVLKCEYSLQFKSCFAHFLSCFFCSTDSHVICDFILCVCDDKQSSSICSLQVCEGIRELLQLPAEKPVQERVF